MYIEQSLLKFVGRLIFVKGKDASVGLSVLYVRSNSLYNVG